VKGKERLYSFRTRDLALVHILCGAWWSLHSNPSSLSEAGSSSRGDLEVLGRRPDLLEQLTVAARDLGAYGRRICVFEGVVLSRATEREVTSRTGESLRRASLMIGDHTGEVELVAWRGAADKLSGLEVGERVRIYGALVVRREGRPPSLEVRGFTRIEGARRPPPGQKA